ncbi:MAG: hypothetical protein M0010_23545 [Actinomycetota bacterium]|nr:hypothetical protein [Actinomycetota bacterium]
MAAGKPPPDSAGTGAARSRRRPRRGGTGPLPGRLDVVERRLAALEADLAAALGRLVAELRTERLVVVDKAGAERIVGEVVGGHAELRLDLPGSSPPRRSSVLVFSSAPGREPGEAIGLQLWVEGDLALDLGVIRDLGGPWRLVKAMAMLPEPEHPPGRSR